MARAIGKKRIEINSSAQPNSNPHLGTVTTLFCVFALAQRLQSETGLATHVVFDYLENARASLEVIGGKAYQHSLSSARTSDGQPLYSEFLPEFERLLSFAAERSGISFRMRSYDEFQQDAVVRKLLLRCMTLGETLRPLLAPNERHLHIRFPCPACGLIEKACDTLTVEDGDPDCMVLRMICPHHGPHSRELSVGGRHYFDTGTSVRDVVKVAALGIQAEKEGALSVMLDGSDWGGAWAWNISALGATHLGSKYAELPVRYFSPAILDATGSKFSKSVFVASNTYDYLPRELLDSASMHALHGDAIFERLWKEVLAWVSSPARFFRNYSIEYMVDRMYGA
ncbi:MAG: hypothetical protein ABL916_11520 [Burkholderiaceae bacterium]